MRMREKEIGIVYCFLATTLLRLFICFLARFRGRGRLCNFSYKAHALQTNAPLTLRHRVVSVVLQLLHSWHFELSFRYDRTYDNTCVDKDTFQQTTAMLV